MLKTLSKALALVAAGSQPTYADSEPALLNNAQASCISAVMDNAFPNAKADIRDIRGPFGHTVEAEADGVRYTTSAYNNGKELTFQTFAEQDKGVIASIGSYFNLGTATTQTLTTLEIDLATGQEKAIINMPDAEGNNDDQAELSAKASDTNDRMAKITRHCLALVSS